MIVYMFLLVLSVLALAIHKKTERTFWAILPYIFMALVGGFRSDVGADYWSYKSQYYEIIKGVGWAVNFEPGFRLLVRTIDYLGFSYQMMFLIMSCLTCAFYYRFINENSSSYELSTIMFMCLGPFYLNSFNAVRQSLAIAIFLFALKYLDKDIKKYYMWMLIASSFHISAILFLIIPILLKILVPILHSTNKVVLIVVAMIVVGGVYLMFRFNVVNTFIASFFSSRLRLIESRIVMDKSYLIYFFVSIVLLILKRRSMIYIKPILSYMLLYTCMLIFIAFFMPNYSVFLTRFISWGTPALIIVLPEVRKVVKPNIVYSFLLCVGCVGYYCLLITRESARLYPYSANFKIFK